MAFEEGINWPLVIIISLAAFITMILFWVFIGPNVQTGLLTNLAYAFRFLVTPIGG
jgi:hypothetical protein